MDPTFQPATESDVATLVTMMGEFYALDAYPFDERIAQRALRDLLDNPAFGRAWLIRDEEVSIGYLVLTFGYSLEFHGRDAFVDELYVRAGHRERGVGTRALALAEQTCREVGVEALHLEVERTNLPAQRLYRARGFRDHERYLMTKWL